MINVAQATSDIIFGDGRTFVVEFLKGGTPITGDVGKVTFYRGASGNTPDVGTIFVPYVDAEIRNCTTSLEGETITARIGVGQGGVVPTYAEDPTAWFDFGTFVVSKPELIGKATKFRAIGTLGTIGNEEAVVTQSYPASIATVLSEVSAGTGMTITLQGVSSAGTTSEMLVGSWRDVLAVIAKEVGGFVTEAVNGDWVIAAYGSGSTISIAADRSHAPLEYGEQTVTLGGVSFESGRGKMEMGNPLIDPWDTLSVLDLEGSAHQLPPLQIMHTIDGGLSTTIDASVETTTEESAAIAGPVTRAVNEAQINARDAIDTANETAQYFWFVSTGTDVGAHITEVPKDEFTDPTSPNYQSGGNTRITSSGIAIRNGMAELATFTTAGVQVGRSSKAHVLASDTGVSFHNTIGAEVGSISVAGYSTTTQEHLVVVMPEYLNTSDMLKILTGETAEFPLSPANDFDAGTMALSLRLTVSGSQAVRNYIVSSLPFATSASIGDRTVSITVTETDGGMLLSVTPSGGFIWLDNIKVRMWYATTMPTYTFGTRGESGTTGPFSFVEGTNNIASGYASHAEGYNNTVTGTGGHAEGTGNTVTGGHAEGTGNTVTGGHAEGSNNEVSGVSHVEGMNSKATGNYSHAEGFMAEATAEYAHAQNHGTLASSAAQTALGKWNVEDLNGDYAVIVGNGVYSSQRSNALTVDWTGNVAAAGAITSTGVTVGGNSLDDFVISHGTSGEWKYRKWKSGAVEAWCTHSFASSTGTAWGNVWYKEFDLAIPSGIFTTAPNRVFVTSSGRQWWVVGYSSATTTKIETIRFARPASSAAVPWANVYAAYLP